MFGDLTMVSSRGLHLIRVHEFGHFIVARMSAWGRAVLIGFLSFTGKETEYCLSLVPVFPPSSGFSSSPIILTYPPSGTRDRQYSVSFPR